MLQVAEWSYLVEGGACSEGHVGEDSFDKCCSKGAWREGRGIGGWSGRMGHCWHHCSKGEWRGIAAAGGRRAAREASLQQGLVEEGGRLCCSFDIPKSVLITGLHDVVGKPYLLCVTALYGLKTSMHSFAYLLLLF